MLYLADGVRDAENVRAAPGAVAIADNRVLAAGDVQTVREAAEKAAGERGRVRVQRLAGRLLLPGLVNAHTHLDLTSVGYRTYPGTFTAWLRQVMAARPTEGDAVAASVRLGVQRSLQAGVLTVGDIVAAESPTDALRNRHGLAGVSYLELFGITGASLEFSMNRLQTLDQALLQASGPMRLGLQPHAPYSAGPDLYAEAARIAARFELPLSTHLHETPSEATFTSDAAGVFRRLLVEIGKWSENIRRLYGHGRRPVEWLDNVLNAAVSAAPPNPWLCAHCNYVNDADIARIAANGWSVAYCPRASDYFGHRAHRYRDMLQAGVNVCIGTDSIVCNGSLSVLDEMRYLHQRDGTDADLLLRMATVNGMRALGLNGRDATFAPGAAAGLIAVRYNAPPPPHATQDPLLSVLTSAQPLAIETWHRRTPQRNDEHASV